MKPNVPLLAPLLRSDTQGRLLAELYLFPERERTASQLARDVHTSLPTVLRELDRMVPMGFLTERFSGRNRYIRVNREHPLYNPVADIVRYSYGPLAILPGMLAPITGIEEAYVYGSWAARLAGEAGSDPQDVDVLVVGTPDRLEIFEAAERGSSALGREVNIRAVSRSAWDAGGDAFLRTVKARPLARLALPHPDAG
ncbi:ArsR family transcriptional regulator [Herbiconiux sp. CPCC 205763]|uniref:ArsR family transcriptional regulator n=1 Tax=Herbiconiux aconitum TaxID=2970913 RepID=A0ABT2GPB6_9MICO|nr:ArsR family transcriptional regulator [Herbiconiux aconitum]MCS5718062.1 ArsR family transcriptional regulator [Herbiconiux aconitum]